MQWEESVSQHRRCKRHGFDPWLGKNPWGRKWQPTPVFLPGKFCGQRSLAGYSPWGRKESTGLQRVGHDWTHTNGNKNRVPGASFYRVGVCPQKQYSWTSSLYHMADFQTLQGNFHSSPVPLAKFPSFPCIWTQECCLPELALVSESLKKHPETRYSEVLCPVLCTMPSDFSQSPGQGGIPYCGVRS